MYFFLDLHRSSVLIISYIVSVSKELVSSCRGVELVVSTGGLPVALRHPVVSSRRPLVTAGLRPLVGNGLRLLVGTGLRLLVGTGLRPAREGEALRLCGQVLLYTLPHLHDDRPCRL